MRVSPKILTALAAIILASVAVAAQATPQTGYFIYDEAGHLIGEYDANGNAIQEHIYLGDRPVAVVQGQTGSVGYVTADQLNTPRAITDQNATLEWSWTSDPFGNGQPTGSLTYNIGFPGQYYDQLTGRYYNYMLDFDPGTGRYIESDPVGLRAGVNTYTYADDIPTTLSDASGLCPASFVSGFVTNSQYLESNVLNSGYISCREVQVRNQYLGSSGSLLSESGDCANGCGTQTCQYIVITRSETRSRSIGCKNSTKLFWSDYHWQSNSTSLMTIQYDCKTKTLDLKTMRSSN